MGDHIVRRGPPTRPPQPRERRPTAEIPEQQLLELIRNPTDDDLEAELELVDAFPKVLPDATPDSLPSMGSPRFAHTLRRGMQAVAVPTKRPPPPPPPAATTRSDKRPASTATAMPRMPARSDAGGRTIGRIAVGRALAGGAAVRARDGLAPAATAGHDIGRKLAQDMQRAKR